MSPKRILVVDDDPAMVATLCDILELNQWETIRAADGAEAATRCRLGDLDVVLMDIRMPAFDGVEALIAIKEQQPALPVVLVTAIAPAHLLAQAAEHGAFRILRKPVDVEELLQVLNQAVAGAD